jgi:hypothetical protein
MNRMDETDRTTARILFDPRGSGCVTCMNKGLHGAVRATRSNESKVT